MNDILVVGTGRIARDYVRVLKEMRLPLQVIGRSAAGTQAFSHETGLPAISGGIEAYRATNHRSPSLAIAAVDIDQLPLVAGELLDLGCKKILLEKPGALTKAALEDLARRATELGAHIYIAYNRRHLASVAAAKKMIEADGGVSSFSFEFNERVSQPETLQALETPRPIVEKWFIANSTHVVDLAFYLGGLPVALEGYCERGERWGSHPAYFAGAGITNADIPFSYFANWDVAGPWAVTIGTAHRTLVLSPLEKLFVRNASTLEPVEFDATLDTAYRPGLYRQIEEFLGEHPQLPTLAEQIVAFTWYEKILRPFAQAA